MKHGIRAFSFALVALLLATLLLPARVYADAPSLVFSEVKTRNDTVGYDEFIEIFNPTTTDISLNDYLSAISTLLHRQHKTCLRYL